ncbi:DUF5000 domain-containing lipoprotein [Compostibacter hankyongensis]|uniref:DUF5000 domain-containing lipoprotein n=1 Tax=Compostibacter hankyongensis TaxID=1007089 RepID=A0ABP8G400_9BACT
MKYLSFLIPILLPTLLSGCKEEKLGPFKEGGPAPEPVSGVHVSPRHGGAKLTYTLPQDPHLFYVKAEYEIRPGKTLEKIQTFYNNTLTLEGFGDTLEHEVRLYSVSRGDIRSEPVIVKVKPLSPPVLEAFKSLTMQADFGGVTVHFENEDSGNIVISVLTKDSVGETTTADIFYTSLRSGQFSVRGFAAEKRWFGLCIRDRWDNRSDTLTGELTPLFEQKLDKKKFKSLVLTTDAVAASATVQMSNLWDDVTAYPQFFRTATGSGIPHWFTMDLGTTAKLSRYVMIQRGAFDENTLLYSAGDPKLWEVWGSNQPAPDGSWEGWTKLADCESVKPSGSGIGQNTNDDIAKARAGQEFSFPLDAPPVRYIRIKMLQTWGNSDYMWMSELTFYGQPQQ